MITLATPSQYEASLEGLNKLRPLKLADKCKTELTYSVLCVNPVEKDRPAIGKLARCSGDGALLKTKNVSYDNVELKTTVFTDVDTTRVITFSQKVFQVFARVQSYRGYNSAWWVNPTYNNYYMSVDFNKTVMFPFVGQIMYFKSLIIGGDWLVVSFYGFY